jgi:hypothetical protein
MYSVSVPIRAIFARWLSRPGIDIDPLIGPECPLVLPMVWSAFEFARMGELGVAWPDHLVRWYEAFRERPSASL